MGSRAASSRAVWSGCASLALLLAVSCAKTASYYGGASPASRDGSADSGRPDGGLLRDGAVDGVPDAGNAYAQCSFGGTPGPINEAGSTTSATGIYSNWHWPKSLDSVRSDLVIEHDIPRDGYYWAHQFSFVGGHGGYIGMQAHGGFQLNPPGGAVEITKMAIFAVSAVGIAGELGDVASPNARVYSDFDGGSGVNIHVKYDWVPCHTYRMTVAHDGTELNGERWYAGSITDMATGVTTRLGRIRVTAESGKLGTWSVMWTERFGPAPVTDCAVQQHASAVFSEPVGDADVTPHGWDHVFANPTYCPNARFTYFAGAVRQEMGAPSP
jgi:hypothetical protein